MKPINSAKKPITLQAWIGPQGSKRLRRISRQLVHERGKIFSPKHRPLLPSRIYSWYTFMLVAESNPGPESGGSDSVYKKSQ